MSTTQNEVQFTAGEGLVLSDLHDMQRFLKSMVFDQGFGANPRVDLVGSGFPDSTIAGFALTPHVGSAYPKPGASTRQVTNTAGMVYQWVSTGAPGGTDCNLLGYQLAANDLQNTLAANSSGNPRIDALCIKLSYDDSQDSQSRDFEDATTHLVSSTSTYKKRRTVLAQQVVAGTPGANPALPTIPAGYCAFAYVFVPNTFATTFDTTHVFDNRMPMRVGSIKTPARMGIVQSVYTLDTPGYRWFTDAGNGQLYMPFPRGGECRILQVNTYGNFSSGVAAKLGRLDLGLSACPASLTQMGAGIANNEFLTNPDALFSTNVYLGNGGKGPTVWGNGFPCGAYAHSVGDYAHNAQTLAVAFSDNNTNNEYFTAVEWIYAY